MVIVGHRGARNEAPENTVESFVHAQQNGCQYFELDIQLSSDDELIVFHDAKLDRTTGIRGKISKKRFRELKNIDARLNTPGWPSPCYIPSLQAVVDSAPQTVHWQFEVKSDNKHRLSVISKKLDSFLTTNKLRNKSTVTSSNRWFLKNIKKAHSDLLTGYIAEYRIPNPIKAALACRCDTLVLNQYLASASRLTQARDAGLNVSCWTVNKLEKMTELQKLGVNNIITDIPTAAIEHFQ